MQTASSLQIPFVGPTCPRSTQSFYKKIQEKVNNFSHKEMDLCGSEICSHLSTRRPVGRRCFMPGYTPQKGVIPVQEEIENRSITLAINTAKLTARVLKEAMEKYLASKSRKAARKSSAVPSGSAANRASGNSSDKIRAFPASRSRTRISSPSSARRVNTASISRSKRTAASRRRSTSSFSRPATTTRSRRRVHGVHRQNAPAHGKAVAACTAQKAYRPPPAAPRPREGPRPHAVKTAARRLPFLFIPVHRRASGAFGPGRARRVVAQFQQGVTASGGTLPSSRTDTHLSLCMWYAGESPPARGPSRHAWVA